MSSIPYTYSIVNVDQQARCMEIVYESPGRQTMHIGARMPYAGETIEAIVRMYEPVAYWLEQEAELEVVQPGTSGSISPPAPPTLEQLKAAKNTQINAARLTANRGTFAHGGKTFACDELSRSDIDGVTSFVTLSGSLPPGWPGGWKAVDNTYLAISTVDEWRQFVASMVAAGNANFAHAQALKAQLAAATTAEEVAAITW